MFNICNKEPHIIKHSLEKVNSAKNYMENIYQHRQCQIERSPRSLATLHDIDFYYALL